MCESNPLPLWGLVLAGGKSTRMGTDKAELEWDGKTWLARAKETVAELSGIQKVLVSRRGGNDTIPDLVPDLGPIGGICSTVMSDQVPADFYLLVLPVDMPWMDSRALAPLIANLREFQDSKIRARNFSGAELPFIFRVNSDSRELLANLCSPEIPPSQRSIHFFLKILESEQICRPRNSERKFLNVNHSWEWNRS